MHGPSESTPSDALVTAGAFHLKALDFFDDTKPLVDAFEAANEALEAAWRARLDAARAAAPARAEVELVDVLVDSLVMAFAEAVRATDEALFGVLFPRDVEDVVAPVGARQVAAMRRICDQLAARDDAAPLRHPWADVLGEAVERYDTAVAAATSREAELRLARLNEEAAREAWFTAVAGNLAIIAEEFPDTDVTERLFFP